MTRVRNFIAGVIGFACGMWLGLSLGLGPKDWN